MDDSWEAVLSRTGRSSFGFFYDEKIHLERELGAYPRIVQFAHPPYGVQFKLAGSRFAFNLVLCRVAPEQDRAARASELGHLAEVYRYFEKLTGNRGITILAGRFGSDHEQASRTFLSAGGEDIIAVRAKTGWSDGRIFASSALRPWIREAGVDTSSIHPFYLTLETAK
jgi:hypothetical protein